MANQLPAPPRSCCFSAAKLRAYGFGYGYEATLDDSKVVIAYNQLGCTCADKYRQNGEIPRRYLHVFSLKRGSWTTPKTDFFETAGVFLNGYLNWISFSQLRGLKIIVLDVEKMKASRMSTPAGTDRYSSRLGTLDKRLCMVTKRSSAFDVWLANTEPSVKKEWSKRYSFTVGVERDYQQLNIICILKDGRIVASDKKSRHLIFYDPSKGSHNVFECTPSMMSSATGIEYIESLASPSDMCCVTQSHYHYFDDLYGCEDLDDF